MKKQLAPNANQYTALHVESVVKTTDMQVDRVVAAALFMQRVLAVGLGCPTHSRSPDVPPDVQADSATRHAASFLAEDSIQVSFMM